MPPRVPRAYHNTGGREAGGAAAPERPGGARSRHLVRARSFRETQGAALVLVLGVLLGSALWWLLLSNGVALFRARVTPRVFRWINRLSGSLLVGFGLLALASLR